MRPRWQNTRECDVPTPWDDARVTLLTQLWLDGYSAQQCADRLGGGITRNSVISKIHREGISARTKTRSPRQAQRAWKPRQGVKEGKATARLSVINGRRKMVGAPSYETLAEFYADEDRRASEMAALAAAPELVIPVNERRTIQTLTEACCRWPIGDPQHQDFHFCGRKKISGLPYCDFHAIRAYAPPKPKSYLPSVHVLAPTVTDRTKSLEEFETLAVRQ